MEPAHLNTSACCCCPRLRRRAYSALVGATRGSTPLNVPLCIAVEAYGMTAICTVPTQPPPGTSSRGRGTYRHAHPLPLSPTHLLHGGLG